MTEIPIVCSSPIHGSKTATCGVVTRLGGLNAGRHSDPYATIAPKGPVNPGVTVIVLNELNRPQADPPHRSDVALPPLADLVALGIAGGNKDNRRTRIRIECSLCKRVVVVTAETANWLATQIYRAGMLEVTMDFLIQATKDRRKLR
ncbi:hypothetical protein [Nakamurella sp. PAMC28650]|uniref:hypothetical protein n=1 Tax=Nakamurella sp. PAMC28650 TaxID=2762325 RepID=UPI00164DF04E|nr:hypothetical protein [Nakamurella sp. PAMC28650]QNK80898.1 hypothetical protein H7F38_22845 [Nakamurella sp. PAMC28650]